MTDTAELSASLEDYIEAIFNISREANVARVKDIAAEVGVNKSSVTGALKALSAKGLVNYDPYSLVTLTPEGRSAAEVVVRRHRVLARFLEGVLGFGAQAAQEQACRLEHAMEPETLSRLLKFVEFVDSCPLAGEKFREGFKRFFGGPHDQCSCPECAAAAREAAAALSERPCGQGKSP